MLVGRCVLTVNSINIAPEINAFTVSVRLCNRCHVQLQAEQKQITFLPKPKKEEEKKKN